MSFLPKKPGKVEERNLGAEIFSKYRPPSAIQPASQPTSQHVSQYVAPIMAKQEPSNSRKIRLESIADAPQVRSNVDQSGQFLFPPSRPAFDRRTSISLAPTRPETSKPQVVSSRTVAVKQSVSLAPTRPPTSRAESRALRRNAGLQLETSEQSAFFAPTTQHSAEVEQPSAVFNPTSRLASRALRRNAGLLETSEQGQNIVASSEIKIVPLQQSEKDKARQQSLRAAEKAKKEKDEKKIKEDEEEAMRKEREEVMRKEREEAMRKEREEVMRKEREAREREAREREEVMRQKAAIIKAREEELEKIATEKENRKKNIVERETAEMKRLESLDQKKIREIERSYYEKKAYLEKKIRESVSMEESNSGEANEFRKNATTLFNKIHKLEKEGEIVPEMTRQEQKYYYDKYQYYYKKAASFAELGLALKEELQELETRHKLEGRDIKRIEKTDIPFLSDEEISRILNTKDVKIESEAAQLMVERLNEPKIYKKPSALVIDSSDDDESYSVSITNSPTSPISPTSPKSALKTASPTSTKLAFATASPRSRNITFKHNLTSERNIKTIEQLEQEAYLRQIYHDFIEEDYMKSHKDVPSIETIFSLAKDFLRSQKQHQDIYLNFDKQITDFYNRHLRKLNKVDEKDIINFTKSFLLNHYRQHLDTSNATASVEPTEKIKIERAMKDFITHQSGGYLVDLSFIPTQSGGTKCRCGFNIEECPRCKDSVFKKAAVVSLSPPVSPKNSSSKSGMLLSEYFKSELPVSKPMQDAERPQDAKGKERKQPTFAAAAQTGGHFVDLTSVNNCI